MRLDEITSENLQKVSRAELLLAHLRMHQLYHSPNATPELKERVKELHSLIVREMERRGIKHTSDIEKMDAEFGIAPILWIPNFISLTGSSLYAKDRDPEDVDIIISGAKVDDEGHFVLTLDGGVATKIERVITAILGVEKDVDWIQSSYGPNNDHIPLYDLVLVPKEELKVVNIENEETRELINKAVQEAARREAERSKKEDKVKVFRFVYPIKTSIDPMFGYRSGEKFSVDSALESLTALSKKRKLDTEIPPCHLQKKYDGIYSEIHTDGKKVKIYTDAGRDITSKLPRISEEILKFKTSMVVICEIERWINKEHQHREDVSAYFNSKEINDEGFIANVFDIIYYNDEDIHKKPYSERYNILKELFKDYQSTVGVPDTKSLFNLTPDYFVTTATDFKKYATKCATAPASEGCMIKIEPFEYELDGDSSDIMKLKVAADLHVIVLEVNETKTEGVYNYEIGISFSPENRIDEKYVWSLGKKKYHHIGRTYNTKVKAEVGDILTVRFTTMNLYTTKTGVRLHLYSPMVYELDPDEDEPDTFDTAIQIGEEAGILARKIYLILKSEDPYQRYPDERVELGYVRQIHAIKKGAHMDERIAFAPRLSSGKKSSPSTLLGYTKAVKVADADFEDDITSVSQLKKYVKDPKYWKIDLNTMEFKKRQIRSGVVRKTSILAFHKDLHPLPWLKFEGLLEPGTPGGAKDKPGVMVIVDKGICDYGARNGWMEEYFYYGGKRKERLIYRVLPKRAAKILVKSQGLVLELVSFTDDAEETLLKRIAIDRFEPDSELIATSPLWLMPNAYSPLSSVPEKIDDFVIKSVKIAPNTVALLIDCFGYTVAYSCVKSELEGDIVIKRDYKRQTYEDDVIYVFKDEDVLPPSEEQPSKEGLTFINIQPDDQTPYVLSKRAIKDGYLPPLGVSALPKELKEQIPKELRYWEAKDTKEALERRQQIVEEYVVEGTWTLKPKK